MSLEQDLNRQSLEQRYASIRDQVPRIVAPVQHWADEATQLHADVTDAGEKAEVLALRDDLIARINAALGL